MKDDQRPASRVLPTGHMLNGVLAQSTRYNHMFLLNNAGRGMVGFFFVFCLSGNRKATETNSWVDKYKLTHCG